MSETPLSFNHPPELSDQSASALLDMLYELAAAVENHYGLQIRRHHADLCDDVNADRSES
jgi:hypothetical protein